MSKVPVIKKEKSECIKWWNGLFFEEDTGRYILKESKRYKEYVIGCKQHLIYPDDKIGDEEFYEDDFYVKDKYGNDDDIKVARLKEIQRKRKIAKEGREKYSNDTKKHYDTQCNIKLANVMKSTKAKEQQIKQMIQQQTKQGGHPSAKLIKGGKLQIQQLLSQLSTIDEFEQLTAEEKFNFLTENEYNYVNIVSEYINKYLEENIALIGDSDEAKCDAIQGKNELVRPLEDYLLEQIFNNDMNIIIGEVTSKTSINNKITEFLETLGCNISIEEPVMAQS